MTLDSRRIRKIYPLFPRREQTIATEDIVTIITGSDTIVTVQSTGSVAQPQRMPTDSHDFLVWRLNENGTTFYNSGTYSGADATMYAYQYIPLSQRDTWLLASGAINYHRKGLYDYCLNFPGVQRLFIAAGTGSNTTLTSTANLSASSFTISCWIFKRKYLADYEQIFFKQITNDLTTFPTPFGSAFLQLHNTADGRLRFAVSVGGGHQFYVADIFDRVTLSKWHHIGMSFDGSTVRMYLDGNMIMTQSNPGAVSWSNGPWAMGACATTVFASQIATMMIMDARAANTVRDAKWFRDMYMSGTGYIY